jgi:hypothetical protein
MSMASDKAEETLIDALMDRLDMDGLDAERVLEVIEDLRWRGPVRHIENGDNFVHTLAVTNGPRGSTHVEMQIPTSSVDGKIFEKSKLVPFDAIVTMPEVAS